MKTLSKENLFSYALAVGSAAFSRLALLFIMVINGKVMDRDQFGLFSILFLVDYIFSGIISGGGDLWLNPYTSHDDAIKKRSSQIARLYLKIVRNLAIGFSLPLFLLPQQYAAIQAALAYGIIAGINEGLFAVLRSSDRVKTFFIIRDFLCPILLIVLSLNVSHFTATQFFWSAFTIYGLLCVAVVAFLYIHSETFLPQSPRHKGLKRHTLHMIVNTTLTRGMANIDVIALTFFMPLDFVGFYRICGQIGAGFQIVQHFTFLTLPWQLAAHNNQKVSGKNLLMIRQRQYILMGSATMALFLMIWGAPLIIHAILGHTLPFFTDLHKAFVVIMILRFAEISWGPIYALLLSNKLAKWDNLMGLLSTLLWCVTFFIHRTFLIHPQQNVITSILIALSFSILSISVVRYLVLKFHNLEKMTQMGVAIPSTISIMAGMFCLMWLL